MILKRGIALISLVITIILMTLIAGIGIAAGLDSINKAKVSRYNNEMQVIYARVNELREDYNLEELNELGQAIPSDKLEKVSTALGGASSSGYKYFDKATLESDLGIIDVDREITINFETKDILDINGIEKDGKIIYRLSGWSNNDYIDQNTISPTFSLNKKNYGLSANIIVSNIKYGGNVNKGTISYCLMHENEDGQWLQASDNTISVSVSGIYKVKIVDAAGNERSNTISVMLVNKPQLDENLVPVKYVQSGDYWAIADEDDGEWFDYGRNKYAYVYPLEGLKVDVDEVETDVTITNRKSLIGKKVVSSGILQVWLPRLIYQIPAEGENATNIKYLKGSTSIATDNTNVQIRNTGAVGTWSIHDAFMNNDETGVWKLVNNIEDNNIVGLLDIYSEEDLIIPATIAKTDTISWTPSGHYEWNKEYAFDNDTEDNVTKQLYSGDEVPAGAEKAWTTSSDDVDLTISSWKVLNVDISNNTITLVPEEATTGKIRLRRSTGI